MRFKKGERNKCDSLSEMLGYHSFLSGNYWSLIISMQLRIFEISLQWYIFFKFTMFYLIRRIFILQSGRVKLVLANYTKCRKFLKHFFFLDAPAFLSSAFLFFFFFHSCVSMSVKNNSSQLYLAYSNKLKKKKFLFMLVVQFWTLQCQPKCAGGTLVCSKAHVVTNAADQTLIYSNTVCVFD